MKTPRPLLPHASVRARLWGEASLSASDPVEGLSVPVSALAVRAPGGKLRGRCLQADVKRSPPDASLQNILLHCFIALRWYIFNPELLYWSPEALSIISINNQYCLLFSGTLKVNFRY